jgi:hypothetical protein
MNIDQSNDIEKEFDMLIQHYASLNLNQKHDEIKECKEQEEEKTDAPATAVPEQDVNEEEEEKLTFVDLLMGELEKKFSIAEISGFMQSKKTNHEIDGLNNNYKIIFWNITFLQRQSI